MIMGTNIKKNNRLYFILMLIVFFVTSMIIFKMNTNNNKSLNVSENSAIKPHESLFSSLMLTNGLRRKDLPNIKFEHSNLYRNSFKATSVTVLIPDGSLIDTFKVRVENGKLFTADALETMEFIGSREHDFFIYQMPDLTNDRIDFEFLSEGGEVLAQISVPAVIEVSVVGSYGLKIETDFLLEFLPSKEELLVLEPEIDFDKLELDTYNNSSTYIRIQLPEGYPDFKIQSISGTLNNLVNKEFYGNRENSSVKYINANAQQDELVFWFFPANQKDRMIKRVVLLEESKNSNGDTILKILQILQ